jgi:hypothetical protein
VIWGRVIDVFRRRRLDTDLDSQLAYHLDALEAEARERGLSPEDARAAARRAMGGLTQVRQAYRDQLRIPVVDTIRHAFTAVLSLVSSVVSGLIPALKYTGPRISAALGSIGRTASVSRERHRVRSVLVVVQVAIAAVDAVRPAADAKGVGLITDLAAQLPAVNGDADRLLQVIWNLIGRDIGMPDQDGYSFLGASERWRGNAAEPSRWSRSRLMRHRRMAPRPFARGSSLTWPSRSGPVRWWTRSSVRPVSKDVRALHAYRAA